jgi:hypothetical protein
MHIAASASGERSPATITRATAIPLTPSREEITSCSLIFIRSKACCINCTQPGSCRRDVIGSQTHVVL